LEIKERIFRKSSKSLYKNTIKDKTRRTYVAMITAMDLQIGRIVAALKKKKMLEYTLILFTTDNGGGKGTPYEGGVRGVAFANWAGKLKPAVINEPLHMVDVMPTLLALAGAKGSDKTPFDG
jgi:arylsulfatase A-like enzyme